MSDTKPNENTRPNWDEYFLNLAEEISKRSPDPNTKHGCVLVDSSKRVLNTDYNGPVSGLTHEIVSLERPDKYHWFIHAEDNVVAFARCDLTGATTYVTGTPCAPYFRHLLQAGIRKVVQGVRESTCLTSKEREVCLQMVELMGVEWDPVDG